MELYRPQQEGEFPAGSNADIVVVGLGLSGLAVCAALQKVCPELAIVGIDRASINYVPKKMFLVSIETANNWGITGIYEKMLTERRCLISGVKTVDADEIKVSIGGSKEIGFMPMPETVLREGLFSRITTDTPLRLYANICFKGIKDKQDGKVQIETSSGDINARLVIDATGWKAEVADTYYTLPDQLVMEVYGGNFTTSGFDTGYLYLLNLKGFLGWVMPITKDLSELVVAHPVLRQKTEGSSSAAEQGFNEMIAMLNKSGLQIKSDDATAYKMGFGIRPIHPKAFHGPVVPFGEAAGLNNPYNGQLINRLLQYAKILANTVLRANNENNLAKTGKNFYRNFQKSVHLNYLLFTILSENRIRNRADMDEAIFSKLTDIFSKEILWRMLQQEELGVKEVLHIVTYKPAMVLRFMFESLPSLYYLLYSQPYLFIMFFIQIREKIYRELKIIRNHQLSNNI